VLNYSPAQSPERLISAAAAAQKLGVDIDTLVRWHRRHSGPAGYQVAGGAGLAYRNRDIEAWQDRMVEPRTA